MNAWDNAFERRWTIIFLAEILFIILPFPFFYDVNYTPWFFGVPRFIFCWLAYGLFVIFTIFVWWRACLKRPEYHEYEDYGYSKELADYFRELDALTDELEQL